MTEGQRPSNVLFATGRERGESRGEKGSDVIDGGRRVEVGGEETLWVWKAIVGIQPVDVVAAERKPR